MKRNGKEDGIVGLIESEKVEQLHPPIDNVILMSIWENGKIADGVFPLKNKNLCRTKNNGKITSWNEGKIKPWSQWNYEEYDKVYKAIIENFKGDSPLILWENETWIQTSEK